MIADLANNPISSAAVSFLGYRAVPDDEFPHDIYSFLIDGVRKLDAEEGNYLILRWLKAAQSEFEDTYGRIDELRTLPDPGRAPTEALQYLKWIVGLGGQLDAITANASEAQLRRLISVAAAAWKRKGTERGLLDLLASASEGTVRYLDWFYWRALLGVGEFSYGETAADVWLLDAPGRQTGILPDAVDVRNVARGDVLPSAEDAPWTYVSEGAAEGATFSASGGYVEETQADVNGGRYVRADARISATSAEVGAHWTLSAAGAVSGLPWHLLLRDGAREYVLRWSAGEVALTTVTGVIVAGPSSRGFSAGREYAIRLVQENGFVSAYVDGADLFGTISVSAFAASTAKEYGFGYLPGGVQDWTARWANVGPPAELTLDLTSLLGTSEAVPHPVRVRHVLDGRVETKWSYWDGARNAIALAGAFDLPAPVRVSGTNDFRVGVDPAEYCSDLLLLDHGALDLDFAAALANLLRPAGERFFLRAMQLWDDFRGDFAWLRVSGGAEADRSAGTLTLTHASQESVVKSDVPGDSAWTQPQIRAALALSADTGANAWGEVRFCYADELNFYALRADLGARQVKLDKVTAGTRSTLHATPYYTWTPGATYGVAVQTEATAGGALQIRYFVAGNLLGGAIDGDHGAGKLAFAAGTSQELTLTYAELYTAPLTSRRVGPR